MSTLFNIPGTIIDVAAIEEAHSIENHWHKFLKTAFETGVTYERLDGQLADELKVYKDEVRGAYLFSENKGAKAKAVLTMLPNGKALLRHSKNFRYVNIFEEEFGDNLVTVQEKILSAHVHLETFNLNYHVAVSRCYSEQTSGDLRIRYPELTVIDGTFTLEKGGKEYPNMQYNYRRDVTYLRSDRTLNAIRELHSTFTNGNRIYSSLGLLDSLTAEHKLEWTYDTNDGSWTACKKNREVYKFLDKDYGANPSRIGSTLSHILEGKQPKKITNVNSGKKSRSIIGNKTVKFLNINRFQ